ncbi:pyrrolo-quinoline quinone [Acidobacteria bacterium AB60]|nr:pyrrolo-quinoline quinone [Acidobacteria bacterium AB60]
MRGGAVLVFAVAVISIHGQSTSSGLNQQWPVAGQNLSDTRSQPSETTISPSNAAALKPKWVFTTGGSVSATPTVAGNEVYFPDWAGNLYAVDKNTGAQIWSAKVSSYTGVAGDLSRTSPAVYGNLLVFGDNQANLGIHNGANEIAVDRFTGARVWVTQIDAHVAAVVTGSAATYNGLVYQGVSSNEENLATQASYPCCTFRGSMVALNLRSGQIVWKTYDMPENGGVPGGYSGGAIWQPPVVDTARGVVSVGTGNNYTVPAAVSQCQAANPQATNCTAANDYFESVLALDLHSGAVHWSRRLAGYDAWTVACLSSPTAANCPSPAGPDWDLGGSGGNLLSKLVGFGQKSGIYWALNPANGSVLWGTPVGPGGTLGGIEWGTATDGQRIYVAISDSLHTPYTLKSGQTITWGSWSALDLNGNILWQTPDPTAGAIDMGAVSVANGVVYTDSITGYMYALDAATGKILWSFNSGGTVVDGPSIVDGVVYWGSGFPNAGGTVNNKVYAFSVRD